MKTNRLTISLLALGFSAFLSLKAQISNLAPITMSMQRDSFSPGLFVRFSSQVGRIYRLEESITLTNWTLKKQIGLARATA